jgi:hypothetical protein
MKKGLILLALTSLMIFCFTTVTPAAELYLDTLITGGYQGEYNGGVTLHPTGTASTLVFGINYPIDPYKIVFELGQGNVNSSDDDYDNQFTNYQLKGGYCVLQNEQSKLDVTLSYFSQANDDIADSSVSGFLLGGDYSYKISPQMSLLGSLDFSLSAAGSAKAPFTLNQASLFNYKLKYLYYFCDNIAAALSFRSSTTNLEYEGFTVDNTISGLTLGVLYGF